uniref:Uncharacterized protein n=1 Tax=Parascaris univalens TaxID=6257 RepID=A0A915B6X1_PARUN
LNNFDANISPFGATTGAPGVTGTSASSGASFDESVAWSGRKKVGKGGLSTRFEG